MEKKHCKRKSYVSNTVVLGGEDKETRRTSRCGIVLAIIAIIAGVLTIIYNYIKKFSKIIVLENKLLIIWCYLFMICMLSLIILIVVEGLVYAFKDIKRYNVKDEKYKNYDETDSKTKTPDKEVKIFTYGIDLTKQGESGAKLSGVEFKLTDGNNEINVKQSGNAYYPSKDADASSTVTTDNDGKIYIRGLKPGTYKLTETKTNNGYVRLKNPVVIVITQTSAETGNATATVGGKAVTMNADDNGSLTAKVPLTVVNSKGFDLPATGGRGIALFTIAGIAIVAAAGSLLFMRKRSK